MVAKILIVDDDVSNRGLLEILLKQAGYEVILAEQGKPALHLIDNTFTLAFIDMHLPDMSGTLVIESLRSVSSKTFIIAATMDDNPDTIKSAYAAGSDMFLVKPYDVTQLVEMVQGARRGKRWIVDRLGIREYWRD